MRNLLSFADISSRELAVLLSKCGQFKSRIKAHRSSDALKGKVVGLLFEKPSTRTRASFEVATLRLGGDPVYLSASELQLSRGEPLKDTARILGGYFDALVARVYAHDTVVQLARYSGIPLVNALSDLEHPTQIVSDLFTILEVKGSLKGLNLAFISDGDNVCNSLLLGAATVGMNMVVACPPAYGPNAEILAKAEKMAKDTGSVLRIVNDPKEAAAGADVLYSDVWVSMGQEDEKEQRMKAFSGYQINPELLGLAAKDAIVMHCLPAHRGLEITDEVLEGKQSVAWQEGENKLYGAAAVLDFVINS